VKFGGEKDSLEMWNVFFNYSDDCCSSKYILVPVIPQNYVRKFLFAIIVNKIQYHSINCSKIEMSFVLPYTPMDQREKRARDRSPSGNPAPRKRRDIQNDSSDQSDIDIESVVEGENNVLDFDKFRENVTTVFFKHYLVVDKTHDEARDIFYRAITHLIALRPVFHSSYGSKFRKRPTRSN